MNDRSKFCFLWKCGCVISERGLKLGVDNKCVKCVADYEDDDIVVLNPTEEDIALMKSKLLKRKDKIKNKKNKIKQENVIKQEFITKEEPFNEVKDEKPVISSFATVKTENVKTENIETIKKENSRKLEHHRKKEQSKRKNILNKLFCYK